MSDWRLNFEPQFQGQCPMWFCAAWPNLESSGVFNGLQYFLIGLSKLKFQTNGTSCTAILGVHQCRICWNPMWSITSSIAFSHHFHHPLLPSPFPIKLKCEPRRSQWHWIDKFSHHNLSSSSAAGNQPREQIPQAMLVVEKSTYYLLYTSSV
jgi:hypothetical protein